MAELLDLEDKKLKDAIIVLKSRDGRRISLTKDQILDLVEAGDRSRASAWPEEPRDGNDTLKHGAAVELDDVESLSLFSLGKRVAGLEKTHGKTKKLGAYNVLYLQEWLRKFDGVVPKRFSSQVGMRLRKIQTWSGCTKDLGKDIDDFLLKYPRLDQDGKRK